MVNPLNDNRTASLYFVASGAPWPGVLLSGPITISPTDRVFFDDVLATLNPAAGLLYVALDEAGPVVTSRTYNLEPGGATFGQGIPAIPIRGNRALRSSWCCPWSTPTPGTSTRISVLSTRPAETSRSRFRSSTRPAP